MGDAPGSAVAGPKRANLRVDACASQAEPAAKLQPVSLYPNLHAELLQALLSLKALIARGVAA